MLNTDLIVNQPISVSIGEFPVRDLSVDDAMELLKISRPTVLDWLKKGKLKGTRLNDADKSPWLISPESVEERRLELVDKYEQMLEGISISALDYHPEEDS